MKTFDEFKKQFWIFFTTYRKICRHYTCKINSSNSDISFYFSLTTYTLWHLLAFNCWEGLVFYKLSLGHGVRHRGARGQWTPEINRGGNNAFATPHPQILGKILKILLCTQLMYSVFLLKKQWNAYIIVLLSTEYCNIHVLVYSQTYLPDLLVALLAIGKVQYSICEVISSNKATINVL